MEGSYRSEVMMNETIPNTQPVDLQYTPRDIKRQPPDVFYRLFLVFNRFDEYLS